LSSLFRECCSKVTKSVGSQVKNTSPNLTMMCILFQKAAHLNDKGITALIEGDEMVAIEAMVKAIELLKAGLLKLDHSPCSRCSNRQFHGVTIRKHSANLESLESIAFDQAIRIPTDLVEPSADDITVYISAVLFNLALAYHSTAAASEDVLHRLKATTTAEKLYGLVSRMLLDDSAFFGVQTVLVVKLACISNSTQLQYSRGDYKVAREDRRLMLSWLLRQPASSQGMIEDPQIQRLLMLILLVRPPTVAAAA
jgi:hypothetical protein